MARCPECNERLTLLTEVEIWEHIFCNACGAELEVVDKDPLELETVYEVDDDGDLMDDFDDEEDEAETWDAEETFEEDEDEW